MTKVIGIDTGGTLTKIAHLDAQGELQYVSFPSNDLQAVREWILAQGDLDEIGVTGGRTEQLREALQDVKTIHYIVEFEATLKGVRYLLKQQGHQIDECIITNIGTGTSVHYMNGNHDVRVGGTGIGGGTLIGLSTLMTGITDFEEIRTLANVGKREHIDLLVEDIYQGMDTPIDGKLTASNFGKVGITEQGNQPVEDVLATIQGLVGEVITTFSIQYADEKKTEHIVYIGSTLSDNAHLERVIANYTRTKKHSPVFVGDHGFAGAVGALLNILEHAIT